MDTNGFIAEVQALRQLIVEKHAYENNLVGLTYQNNMGMVQRLQATMNLVFGSNERDQRLQAVGILIGPRDLDSFTTGKNKRGLTIGEASAIIGWCEVPDSYGIRRGAAEVLSKLRDNPALYGTQISKYLSPMTVPEGAIYAAQEQEENPIATAGPLFEAYQEAQELPF